VYRSNPVIVASVLCLLSDFIWPDSIYTGCGKGALNQCLPNATILCGLTIGQYALVGAAVVPLCAGLQFGGRKSWASDWDPSSQSNSNCRRSSEGRTKLKTTMRVPFVDLKGPHRALKTQLQTAFSETLVSAHLIGSPKV